MRDLITELSQIGFTEYDARIYLALLSHHPATGYQISKESGVPRSMAYESLARLAGRGAVLKSSSGKTTAYRPLPPDVLLARLQDEHETRVRKLSDGMSRLFAAQAADALWSIDTRSAILAYATEMIRSAEAELMLVLSDQDIPELEAVLKAANARGVQVRFVLTGTTDPGFGEVVYHPPRESELQELTGSLVIVVDSREALIAGGDDASSATVTTNSKMVLLARQFIWMELFAQRIYARIGADLLEHLEPEDRQVLEGYSQIEGVKKR
jgi:Cd2+/Zn2+-exporting ATPase